MCEFHFSDRTTLDELRIFISTAQQQMMPFESHCGVAQPYFSSECNSTHVQLVNDGASALRNQNRKFIPHVSPYVSCFIILRYDFILLVI